MQAPARKKLNSNLHLDPKFEEALRFFRERSPVIFVSQHYRFWEKHGFVQQSLARALVEAGIPVIWLDGASWKKIPPVQTWDSPLLTVSQLPQLPLRRIPWVDDLAPTAQTAFLKKQLAKGKKPFLWVFSGIDERIAAKLPYVDVFSVFDDPYLHSPGGELCRKAQLIQTQNEYTRALFAKTHPDKTQLALPPVDMDEEFFEDESEFELPPCFPEKIMGYIGTFIAAGFDLVLFEDFLKSFPDWGFILAGRTDAAGERQIKQWSGYRNFLRLDWVPREKVGALWRCLDVNLMLYRPHPTADGAFPVKILEALHYGIPSVATRVPKTSSLEGYFPRGVFADQIKSLAAKAGIMATQNHEALREYFLKEMNPQTNLIRVYQAVKKI